ncbi:MAG: hypothetical protein M5U34_23885 [Chloroflexi bacterium]|nr:hypothetical protein [Chloroflexota bacterium]
MPSYNKVCEWRVEPLFALNCTYDTMPPHFTKKGQDVMTNETAVSLAQTIANQIAPAPAKQTNKGRCPPPMWLCCKKPAIPPSASLASLAGMAFRCWTV